MSATGSAGDQVSMLELASRHATTSGTHAVQFYNSDDVLIDELVRFTGAALLAGDPVVVLATVAHREQLAARLQSRCLDIGAATAQGRYVAHDAAEILARIMRDGEPDAARFHALIGSLLDRASANRDGKPPRSALFGELVALLCAEGNHAAAIRLEQLWNELGQTRAFSLLCAYPMDVFPGADAGDAFAAICAAHARVMPAKDDSALVDETDRLQATAILQQKARSLEREVAERKRVEAHLREEREALETINRVGRLLTAELDLAALVQAVTDAATTLTGAQFGAFFYNAVDERGEYYTLYTIAGVPAEMFASFPLPRNTALFGPTFRGEGVIRLNNVHLDSRFGHNPPYHGMPSGHLPVVSYLAVPVVSRSGEVLGGLFFGHSEPGMFRERAEQLAVGLAAQAGVAVENARLYQLAQAELAARQQAAAEREAFVDAVAHDLGNPLAALKGQAQLLRRRAQQGRTDQATLEKGLAAIDEAAERTARLLSELTDAARLAADRPLELNRTPTDLVTLARTIAAEMPATATGRQIRVTTSLPSLVGSCDADRLARVLENLLANAIKYSPGSSVITVAIDRDDGANGASAVISIFDQGGGIPATDLPHVFERFRRGGNVEGRIAGTGLGLWGSQQIVAQHGGAIAIESVENQGTTVMMRLPL